MHLLAHARHSDTHPALQQNTLFDAQSSAISSTAAAAPTASSASAANSLLLPAVTGASVTSVVGSELSTGPSASISEESQVSVSTDVNGVDMKEVQHMYLFAYIRCVCHVHVCYLVCFCVRMRAVLLLSHHLYSASM